MQYEQSHLHNQAFHKYYESSLNDTVNHLMSNIGTMQNCEICTNTTKITEFGQ